MHVAPLGSMWSGFNCAHDMSECDQVQMVKRCRDLSYSKSPCLKTMSKELERSCFWNHGTAEPSEDTKNFAVDVEPDSKVEIVAELDNSNRHKTDSPREVAEIAEDYMAETVPAAGLPVDKMVSRCAELSRPVMPGIDGRGVQVLLGAGRVEASSTVPAQEWRTLCVGMSLVRVILLLALNPCTAISFLNLTN